MHVVSDRIALKTKQRLNKFNNLRGQHLRPGEFWDYVVLTAIDETQKECYEVQLKMKAERKELPLSKYVVVADPPGPKIGNGGSTLFVIEQLTQEFGLEVLDKRIIIVHAGGFSQRLPNASILGKVFLGVPVGEPMYQTLDLKLASYIDFPRKIISGGVFVCSADSLEVYDDCDIPWTFGPQGITALAHMSPTSIGETHGVFVLDQQIEGQTIIWDCKKFLHKPTVEKMTATRNCIVREKGGEKWVMTDSAFFISKTVAIKLLEFYCNIAPLSCEVDAYGDFLQALGKESSSDYTSDVKNVSRETGSLVETRLRIYELLKDTPLHAIMLSELPQFSQAKPGTERPNSIFYHLGTMPEYQYHFCQDENFRSMIGIASLKSCYGMPYSFGTAGDNGVGSVTKVSKQGALSCSIQQQAQCSTPCIMSSVIRPNVTVCRGTIIEYCDLGEGVFIGSNCILSNCHVPVSTVIPDGVFMHTAAVLISGDLAFVTMLFDCSADLKKVMPTQAALDNILYFGMPLRALVSPCGDEELLGLWNAKLFYVANTMEESCRLACNLLHSVKDKRKLPLTGTEQLFSMQNVLRLKDTKSTLDFREALRNLIKKRISASHLN